MSKRDYDSLMETIRIMNNPYLMDKIRQGRKQIVDGKAKQHELLDNDD